MAEAKTQPTGASVAAFLAARAGPARLADVKRLSDVHLPALETLLRHSVAVTRQRHAVDAGA